MMIFSKILVFLRLRKPPEFRIGDWIKDKSFSYYRQECEIIKISSDIMFSKWGYYYIVRDYHQDDFVISHVYEKSAERIKGRFIEVPYDPKQAGDCHDDI